MRPVDEDEIDDGIDPREKGDDDGQEYGDPRDRRDEAAADRRRADINQEM